MYPNVILFDMTLYDILIMIGILICFAVFRVNSDKLKLPASIVNLGLISGVLGIICGFGLATLMQSLYEWIETGVWDPTAGMTFYGGLIGGAASFLAIYFIAGHFIYKKTNPGYQIRRFILMSDLASTSIAVAHAFGRLGCLTAGCCHGLKFEEPHWYTVTFHPGEHEFYALPTQLYEAIFLLLLFAYLMYRVRKEKSFVLPTYLIAYGVWRYGIEFLRADDRGKTIVSFMTPSQFIAVIMILIGIGLIFFERYYIKKYPNCIKAEPDEAKAPDAETPEESDGGNNEET